MANKDIFDEKMDALAESINAKAGTSGALTLDGMKSAVDAIELGSSVIANPTLEGGEDDLTSIEIDGTKYAIPEGSSVEANPTLAGTEADLVGIDVDGTKYKVPKGAYIATMTNNTQVSAESLAYINAHFREIPCYVPHTINSPYYLCLFRVIGQSGVLLVTDILTSSSTTGADVPLMWLTIFNGAVSFHQSTASNITANPSGTGSANLTKLRVAGTIYNIPQGTEVSANPTLAGTEAELTGLEVDGTKYKVSSGNTLYCHHILLKNTTQNLVFLKIINNSETPFTTATVYSYLRDNGFTTIEHGYGVSGQHDSAPVMSIYATNDANTFGVYSPNSETTMTLSLSRDNVIAL